MVFDCSCIVYSSSIQPPTKCLSAQFFLCLCILTFFHLVVASFFLFSSPLPIPYSLYIDSDSACCIFHPLWHCHSCLCCRDIVAIELLWLRDSLIVQWARWLSCQFNVQIDFLYHTRQCWKLLSLWNQIGRASKCERLMGGIFGGGGGNSTPVDCRSQQKWGCGVGTSWLWVQALEGDEQVMCGLCTAYRI